ncbi:hypothetical protein Fot_42736 [Forsythia ovata]|uniref:Uncharacterized protein n=1 Tax=Forsythia ovata TaxID=205694 RepID=A0ABD1RQX2_9LAMI
MVVDEWKASPTYAALEHEIYSLSLEEVLAFSSYLDLEYLHEVFREQLEKPTSLSAQEDHSFASDAPIDPLVDSAVSLTVRIVTIECLGMGEGQLQLYRRQGCHPWSLHTFGGHDRGRWDGWPSFLRGPLFVPRRSNTIHSCLRLQGFGEGGCLASSTLLQEDYSLETANSSRVEMECLALIRKIYPSFNNSGSCYLNSFNALDHVGKMSDSFAHDNQLRIFGFHGITSRAMSLVIMWDTYVFKVGSRVAP